MDLERNIFDTVKEWEIKIGYCRQSIDLYYPESSLLELLETKRENLKDALCQFCRPVKDKLGKISIYETGEKGRYCIHIPAEGVEFVHESIRESRFLKEFLGMITNPTSVLNDAEKLFYSFDQNAVIIKEEAHKWALWFSDREIDPYVYFIEEDEFGLQYHRFTPKAYQELFNR